MIQGLLDHGLHAPEDLSRLRIEPHEIEARVQSLPYISHSFSSSLAAACTGIAAVEVICYSTKTVQRESKQKLYRLFQNKIRNICILRQVGNFRII
jgi:hypothetical protein